MRRRGPKAVDVGLLNLWDFEFYKAFHQLRDGIALPGRNLPPPSGFSRPELLGIVARLKSMSGAEYWRVQQQMETEFADNVDLERVPTRDQIQFAKNDLKEEVHWLERALNPQKLQVQGQRRKIWDDLTGAGNAGAVRKASGRWSKLADVRGSMMARFPEYIRANAKQFLAMKRNKRFPHSNYGDDARMDYLARGMAGVLVGVSPMTAIERLRNMKHAPGSPLWGTKESRCKCWRCELNRSNKISKITQGWYENGLRVFIEIADEMKQPRS